VKKVKFISLALSMLICFVVKAQEKTTSKKQSESIPVQTEVISKSFTKSKDTIPILKISSDFVHFKTLPTPIIICAPSRPLINEPLTILDGVVITSKQFSKVNPNDIESIKVLKGIEATSLYGSQGINGVIIIITKNND
jgi:TonB-dependent SusC/RagA subfamily outer membrane receptor